MNGMLVKEFPRRLEPVSRLLGGSCSIFFQVRPRSVGGLLFLRSFFLSSFFIHLLLGQIF
jgi:hypothetical protein